MTNLAKTSQVNYCLWLHSVMIDIIHRSVKFISSLKLPGNIVRK